MTFSVVICADCRFVWIVADRPDTSQCPSCRKTRAFKKLKKYATVETQETARRVRTKVMADLAGMEDVYDREFERGNL